MTTLRRLVFPLFAVCVALAVGLALGTGPMGGSSAHGDAGSSADSSELSDQLAALKEGQKFGEAAATAASPAWINGVLTNYAVTVVALPGVSDARVAATQAAVAQAGGTVVVTVRVADDYVDPAKKTYVDTVADQSLASAADLKAVAKSETYDKIGALVARAYVGHADAATLDDQANQIDSELAGAKLVKVEAAPNQRGTVTVVLAPGSHGGSAEYDARNTIAGELVLALARQGDGTVVVTPPGGGQAGGVIGSLVNNPDAAELKVSTLNVSEGVAAQAAALRALQTAVQGKPGQFGIVAGKVVLPPGI